MERTEQNWLFASEEHGVPQEMDPGCFLQTFYRYSIALSFATELKQREKYLDYGSGCGWGTEFVGAFFKFSVGYDRDARALSYSQKIHNRAGTLFTGDKKRLIGPFDMITFYECIEHMSVEDARETVKFLGKLLHPDGALMISTPISLTNDGTNEKNPYHVHEYHPGELKMLLQEYFSDVKLRDTITGQMAMCKGVK